MITRCSSGDRFHPGPKRPRPGIENERFSTSPHGGCVSASMCLHGADLFTITTVAAAFQWEPQDGVQQWPILSVLPRKRQVR